MGELRFGRKGQHDWSDTSKKTGVKQRLLRHFALQEAYRLYYSVVLANQLLNIMSARAILLSILFGALSLMVP